MATGGTRADPAGIAPVIAVPTTAGTGSEVGRAAVDPDEEAEVKKIIFHPRMMPRSSSPIRSSPSACRRTHRGNRHGRPVALPRSLLRARLPPDGRRHRARGHPLIHDWLPPPWRTAAISTRAATCWSPRMGATAFQKGLGGMHALSHPDRRPVRHPSRPDQRRADALCARFNRPAIEDRLPASPAYIGLPDPSFDSFLDWILALRDARHPPHPVRDGHRCAAGWDGRPHGRGRWLGGHQSHPVRRCRRLCAHTRARGQRPM